MTQPDPIGLDDLNALGSGEYEAVLAPVFEHAGWVAQAVREQRPFTSLTALHAALLAALRDAGAGSVLAFLRGHPSLSPRSLRGKLTAESTAEQTAAGIDRLDADTEASLERMNEAYEAKFGMPFILAVRHASLATLLASFTRRLAASPEAEREEALQEIAAITWMRLLDRVRPAPTGALSTHVLDTVRACPAAGLGTELWRRGRDGLVQLESLVTNANGSSSRDVLGGGRLAAGTYEWRYDTPAYFAGLGFATPARSFLREITVAFSVWNPEQHYHVPLLLTPGSYTTYRGS